MSDLQPQFQPMPVICDACRATGMAGDEAFSAIPDILNFDPVPRKARSDGWTPEHQRAFVAALAVTGSPRQAARAIGKHAFGVEQLRKARGGRSFAAACDAAIDLARERENQRIHANLAELSRTDQDRDAFNMPNTEHRRAPADFEGTDADWDDFTAAKDRIRNRMAGARRLFLANICDDVAMRTAWEVLCGPVDWDAAETLNEQPVEVENFNCHRHDVQVLGHHQLLAELTGGEDVMQQIGDELDRMEAEEARGSGG